MKKYEYYLTVAEVRCKCSKLINIRSKQQQEIVRCWNCGMYSIKLIQGYGQGNYRFRILEHATNREETIKPSFVTQKRPGSD